MQKYFYFSVSKVSAGSFRVSVIHRTLTWTTGSFTCVRDHSYACVYIHTGVYVLGTPRASHNNIFDSEKSHKCFLCSSLGSNFGSSNLEFDALPIWPPRHPYTNGHQLHMFKNESSYTFVRKVCLFHCLTSS